MRASLSIVVILFSLFLFCFSAKFYPGKPWNDVKGNVIRAHAAGILYHEGIYYWYGETRDPDTVGISAYYSKDLYNWVPLGLVLQVPEDQHIIERPKVLYNPTSRIFVMWMHYDNNDYTQAEVGIAIAKAPTGPFIFQRHFSPNNMQSRDMTIFEDEDGSAYLIRASGQTNLALSITRLTPDYLDLEDQVLSTINKSREAPAMLYHQGNYFLMASHCTGWDPNPAELYVSTSVAGPWILLGNPTNNNNTFYAQSTFFLPLRDKYKGNWIFMADKWNYPNLNMATYIWLPVEFISGVPVINWLDSWDLSIFDQFKNKNKNKNKK